jgi:hypothetical protein
MEQSRKHLVAPSGSIDRSRSQLVVVLASCSS